MGEFLDKNGLMAFKEEEGALISASVRAASMTNITYAELKALRDGAQLIPGMQYRITDYATTTVQANTSVAGHQFDVIVTADSPSVLNEDARAALHEGDKYFKYCKLHEWRLQYTLDNVYWSSTVDGKGTILHMEDEKGNEATYDFKNIMFVYPSQNNLPYYCYTFDYREGGASYSRFPQDLSILTDWCRENKIYATSKFDMSAGQVPSRTLPNVRFLNSGPYASSCRCYANVIHEGSTDCLFGNGCYGNEIGIGSYDCTFGDNCYCNKVGDFSYSAHIGKNYPSGNTSLSVHNSSIGDYSPECRLGNYSTGAIDSSWNLSIGDCCPQCAISNGSCVAIMDHNNQVKFDTTSYYPIVNVHYWVIEPNCDHLTIRSNASDSYRKEKVRICSGFNNKVITFPNDLLGERNYTVVFEPNNTKMIVIE